MKNVVLSVLLLLGVTVPVIGQIDSQLFLGLCPISTADRVAVPTATLVEGMTVFDTTQQLIYYFDGVKWVALGTTVVNRTATISPEYPNAIFQDPGAPNIGCINTVNAAVSVGGVLKNFYVWDTTETTPQSYEIVVRYYVPDNFKALQSNWLTVYSAAPGAAVTALTITKDDGTAVLPTTSLTTSPTNFNTSPAIVAGDVLIMTIKLTSEAGASASISDIQFNYIH